MEIIITGVISSLIASIVYAVLSFGIRPKIKISDKICVTKDKDGKLTYKVKIVNNTLFRVINVSYNLDYCTRGRDDISYITEVRPSKPALTVIEKKNSQNTDYALRVTYRLEDGQYVCDKDSYFEFSVQATHPLSNCVVCKKRKFYSEDIAHNCTFETGDSVKIIELRQFENSAQIEQVNVKI